MTTKYGIFNTETGDLVRGPFTEKGAVRSRSAVIERLVQGEMLHHPDNEDNRIYWVYVSWATNPKVKQDPERLIGATTFDGESITKEHVDILKGFVEHYNSIIQIKPVKLVMEQM